MFDVSKLYISTSVGREFRLTLTIHLLSLTEVYDFGKFSANYRVVNYIGDIEIENRIDDRG